MKRDVGRGGELFVNILFWIEKFSGGVEKFSEGGVEKFSEGLRNFREAGWLRNFKGG